MTDHSVIYYYKQAEKRLDDYGLKLQLSERGNHIYILKQKKSAINGDLPVTNFETIMEVIAFLDGIDHATGQLFK